VWKAGGVSVDKDNIKPGMIEVARVGELIVGCGEQTNVLLEELQLEGRRRMSAADFLNGVRPQVGEQLG
jgi:methionyl-tRNA formyltransferase